MTIVEEGTATPGIDSRRIGELAVSAAGDVRSREAVFRVEDLSVTYSGALALSGVTLNVHKNAVTAFIGPSGCGKSTFIRCLNRMNDVIPGARVGGRILDEPASALDPISTTRIEDLIHELKRQYTIAIVTHNMQQAARVADMTAFFSVEVREDGTGRHGILVEYDATTRIFTNPSDKRTEDYVTGRFG